MLVLELGCREQIEQLTFAPCGRALVGNVESGLCVWRDFADGQTPDWVSDSKYLRDPQFTADGRWLFAGATSLKRFDLDAGRQCALKPWHDGVICCAVSPAEPLMLATQFEVGTKGVTRVALWRCDDLTRKGKVWQRDFRDRPFRVWPHFLPGGDRFARVEIDTSARGRSLVHRIWTHDAATGQPLGEPVAVPHDGTVSPDGRWLFNVDGTSINLWPLEGGADRKPVRIRNEGRKHFTGVAFHPSGKYLAAASTDESVKIYEAATGREARTFAWQIGKMRSVAFSPDGSVAAAGSDRGKVVVWDVDF
jgi:WD40 repeat protein